MLVVESPDFQIYGIRHHGAGSARNLMAALERQKPDLVMVECPADAQHLVAYISENLLDPPVAIMIYNQADLGEYAYYPFTSFSPEWRAFQFAIGRQIPIVFFDLPQAQSFCLSEHRAIDTKARRFVRDPFTYMARLAGFEDTERWWDAYIEMQNSAPQMFEVIIELMNEMRSSSRDIKEINLIREAHMRQQMRKALNDGFRNIAVVCGAWHAPALIEIEGSSKIEDQKLLARLKRVKTKCTWVPWSYNRIARHSGYEAGVVSPYWYEELFKAPEQAIFKWMSRAAHMMNQLGKKISPAHTIESSRLADALAHLRGRSQPGIKELFDAVATVYCNGEDKFVKLLKVKLLEGEKVGHVSDTIPTVPLRQDLESLVKKARLTRDWKKQGWFEKKLDLRKASNLLASRLFHRLLLLEIPWAEEQEIMHNPLGTFHEYWGLEWLPDYEIKIIEASMWGNTVAEACHNFTLQQLDQEDNFSDLGDLLYRVLHAHLPHLVEPVSKRIRDLGNLTTDAHLLMLILPPLLWSQRYGDTAQLDTSSVESLLTEIFPRICLLLPNQVQNLTQEVAHDFFEAIRDVHQSIQLMQRDDFIKQWWTALKNIVIADASHPLVKGCTMQILLAKKIWSEAVVFKKLKYELSSVRAAFDPAYFLEGLLHGGGWILVHRPNLYHLIDRWLMVQSEEQFMQYLPILRRAFSTFTPAEKKMLYNLLDQEDRPSLPKHETNQQRREVILPAMTNFLN